jgi:hypothetical protein
MMYDDKLRPYIGKPQSLPLEVLAIINPQTKWGIAMLNSIVWFVSWSGIGKLLTKLTRLPKEVNIVPISDL